LVSEPVDPFLAELFEPLGGVSMRRMFGGVGIFRDGLMIALVADGVLHFKSDAVTDPLFDEEGCEPFAYAAAGRSVVIASFRRAPVRVFDDPDAFLVMAAAAAAAAVRSGGKKPAGTGGRKKARRRG
jgi:DNA transformation protein